MKPCPRYCKQIALLAVDALESRASRDLRAHIDECSGCRGYLAEISDVATTLREAGIDSDIRASEDFHRKTVAKLKMESSGVLSFLLPFERLLNWRVALPAIAALAMIAATLSVSIRRRPQILISPSWQESHSAAAIPVNLAPTVANYEMVANQSLEKLDDLITRQGFASQPTGPVFTVSTLSGSALSE